MRKKENETVKKQIVSLLMDGMSRYAACLEAGISRATFYRWLKQDKKFAREIEEAEEVAVMMVEDALYMKAVKGDVRAMIFYLTNKRPSRWKTEGNATIQAEEDKKIIFEIVDARNQGASNENI